MVPDHGETPVVERDVDLIGLQLVADGEIALLDLEAARAIDAAGIEARIERGEVAELLRARWRCRPRYGTSVPPAS